MASRMIVHTLRVAAVSGDGLENHWRRRGAQRCYEHQNQRRDDSECEKRKQNRKREAEYICRVARNPPHEPGDGETRHRGDHAASVGDFQPRQAMRALETVRERHNARRGNGLSALRAHSNGHYSPRKKHTTISQRAAKEKRGITWPARIRRAGVWGRCDQRARAPGRPASRCARLRRGGGRRWHDRVRGTCKRPRFLPPGGL
jgi:hypothetical protein